MSKTYSGMSWMFVRIFDRTIKCRCAILTSTSRILKTSDCNILIENESTAISCPGQLVLVSDATENMLLRQPLPGSFSLSDTTMSRRCSFLDIQTTILHRMRERNSAIVASTRMFVIGLDCIATLDKPYP